MSGVRLTVLRHAATAWTEARRLQGRADPPLSPQGRAAAAAWRLPADLGTQALILTSPLLRARQTAFALGLDARVEPRLIEADWGGWEGQRLADLRADPAAGVAERERAGLDFTPPDGESPRQVQQRLGSLLAELAAQPHPVLAICHNGVIRALYALAVGWQMLGPPPDRLAAAACHRYRLDASGHPTVDRLNIPLLPVTRKQDG